MIAEDDCWIFLGSLIVAAEEAEAMRKMLAANDPEMAEPKATVDEKASELAMELSQLKKELEMANQKLKPTYNSILLIGGMKSAIPADLEWFYPWDPSRNRLLNTPLPTPSLGHISAVLDTAGTVLIAGGTASDGVGCLSSAVLLDPIAESWTSVQAMSVARMMAGAAVVDGVVYVCGGRNGDKGLSSCERFRSGVWEPISPMSKGRWGLVVVALDGKLCAIGGRDRHRSLSLMEAYDIETDTWTRKTPMPTAQDHFGAAVLGKSIIVCGGIEGSGRECLKYDVEADRWTTIAQMNQGRHDFSVVALGDHLMALGGEDDSAQFTAELYDLEKDEWAMLNGKFKRPRCGHSATVFMPAFSPM